MGNTETVPLKPRKKGRQMLRKDLIKRLSDALGWSKRETADFLQAYQIVVEHELLLNGEVLIGNLGVLSIKTLQARRSRNPKTAETIIAKCKNVVRFRPYASIKQLAAQATWLTKDLSKVEVVDEKPKKKKLKKKVKNA